MLVRIRKFTSASQTVKNGPGSTGIYSDANGDLKFNPDGTARVVPQTINVTLPLKASDVDTAVWIADNSYTLTAIRHMVSTGASGATITVKKCTGTTAPASGSAMHSGTLDLNATANTVVSTTVGATNTVVAGDRIAFDYGGTLTGLVGVATLTLKRTHS